MGLRKADKSETRRFEDGDDYLVLRINLTKGERNLIAELTSNYSVPNNGDEVAREIGIKSAMREYRRTLFGILAVTWSLAAGKPRVDDYEALDESSGEWVDDCLDEVLGVRRERAEGNAPEQETQKPSASASPSEAASE